MIDIATTVLAFIAAVVAGTALVGCLLVRNHLLILIQNLRSALEASERANEKHMALESEQRRALAASNDQSFADIAKELSEQRMVLGGVSNGCAVLKQSLENELTEHRTLSAAAVADCVREISEVKATIPHQTQTFCDMLNKLTDQGGELPTIKDRLLKLETAPAKEPPAPREKPPVIGTFQQQRMRASSE